MIPISIIRRGDSILIQNKIAVLEQMMADGSTIFEGDLYAQGERRTNPQNRMLFGVIYPQLIKGFEGIGWRLNKEECHEVVKKRFLNLKKINEQTGEFITIPRSTTKLSKREFSKLVDELCQFAAEILGITLELPEDYDN